MADLTRIRVAEQGDANAICEIWNPIIRDTVITFTTELKTVDGIAEDIAARAPAFVVAEDRGEVMGFATYGPFRPGPGYRHVREHSVLLAEAARGRGIGRNLMKSLETTARDTGIQVLLGGISGDNPAAIAFHRRIGFEQVGHLPGVGYKFGRSLDLILMQKNLSRHPDTAMSPR